MLKVKMLDPVVRHCLKRPLPLNVEIVFENTAGRTRATVYFVDLPASLYTMLVVRDTDGDLEWEEYRLDTRSQRNDALQSWLWGP